MISAWTKHLTTEEEKKNFENSVRGSKDVLSVLSKLIDEKLEGATAPSTLADYDRANWALTKAHKDGYASALSSIKKLINT